MAASSSHQQPQLPKPSPSPRCRTCSRNNLAPVMFWDVEYGSRQEQRDCVRCQLVTQVDERDHNATPLNLLLDCMVQCACWQEALKKNRNRDRDEEQRCVDAVLKHAYLQRPVSQIMANLTQPSDIVRAVHDKLLFPNKTDYVAERERVLTGRWERDPLRHTNKLKRRAEYSDSNAHATWSSTASTPLKRMRTSAPGQGPTSSPPQPLSSTAAATDDPTIQAPPPPTPPTANMTAAPTTSSEPASAASADAHKFSRAAARLEAWAAALRVAEAEFTNRGLSAALADFVDDWEVRCCGELEGVFDCTRRLGVAMDRRRALS